MRCVRTIFFNRHVVRIAPLLSRGKLRAILRATDESAGSLCAVRTCGTKAELAERSTAEAQAFGMKGGAHRETDSGARRASFEHRSNSSQRARSQFSRASKGPLAPPHGGRNV